MKLFKKVLAGVAVAAALATSAQASMITVDGVTWNPDFTSSLSDKDFTARFDMIQWFTPAASAVANTTNAAPDPTVAVPGAVGNVLQGVGIINKVNGLTSFVNSTAELTFVFGGFTAVAGPQFSGGWLKIYSDSSKDSDLNTGLGFEDGSLWLSLVLDNSNFTGTSLTTGNLNAYFSAIGGTAYGNFKDANIPLFGGSDAFSNIGASFADTAGNPSLFASSTGTMTSNSIPEPESLALVGLGLLGLAASRRRKSAKAAA
jgi:hypothetical protein